MQPYITVLFLTGALFFRTEFAVADSNCGDPPTMLDESIKANISNSANLAVTEKKGVEIIGDIEVARMDALRNYPNADKLRINQYFFFVTCQAISSNEYISLSERIELINKARNEIFPPVKKTYSVTFGSSDFWIRNQSIGDVFASMSEIEFYVDGEYESSMRLNEPFDLFSLRLVEGNHTFTYKADIHAKSGIKIRGSCTIKFDVNSAASFEPLIVFAPYDERRGRIKDCALTSG